jgi:predicted short-subunit dehydrogenase-like oxidoreductase (DUF2520 family)
VENDRKVVFIGLGRVGSLLSRLFFDKGIAIAGFFDLDPGKAETARRGVGQGIVFTSVRQAVEMASVIFLTVSDDQIEPVGREIVASGVACRQKLFVHTSGLLSSEILAPLAARGGSVLSFHPCASISGSEGGLAGVYVALEGTDVAVQQGTVLADCLSAIPFRLDAAVKPVYHFGAAVLSNFLVVMYHEIAHLYRQVGIPGEITGHLLIPLLESTIGNIAGQGGEAALTGPVARGDRGTVAGHLAILSELDNKVLATTILGLIRLTLDLAASQRYIPRDSVEAILKDVNRVQEFLEEQNK